MIIDTHTHFVPAAISQACRERRTPPYIEVLPDGGEIFHMPSGPLAFTDAFEDMEARLDFMKGLGVGRQILSFPGLFGLDSLPAVECAPLLTAFNDQAAGLAKAYPESFSGLAALPWEDMDQAIAEYRRARTELGLIGAILPNNGFASLAHAEYFRPFLEAADALGGHLFIHPGPRPDERKAEGSAPPMDTPPMDTPIARQALGVQNMVSQCMTTLLFTDYLNPYANFTLHVANLGGTLPMVIERMDHVVATRDPEMEMFSARAAQIHVDCASLGPRAIRMAAELFGADHILFGSDCPIFSTEWSIDAVKHSGLDAPDQEKIFSGNVSALLDF